MYIVYSLIHLPAPCPTPITRCLINPPPPPLLFSCMKLALIHDMAECIVGDITPHDNVDKEEKHRRELVIMR